MRLSKVSAVVAAALLVLTACSNASTGSKPAGSSSASVAAGTGTFPVVVNTSLGPVTLKSQPQRIVSLSPSATESLFAIGAGKQVVAADKYSTYPQGAPATDLSGFEPNVEAIVKHKPDLVVISNDVNGLAASMKKLSIPVLLSPAPPTLDAGYGELAILGQATGHVNETTELVGTMRSQINAALSKAPNKPLSVYHELDDKYHSASSHSFIGSIYAKMSATNIADNADGPKSGYPQLTEEAIIKADPQVIVITDQSGYTAQDVARRPGWANVAAVKNGNVVTVNSDIASRWGPRLPQLVDQLAGALTKATAGVGTSAAAQPTTVG
ncbi:ABC transporter substrate-binding protein [Dermatophilus congolensis]|uniref:ABC transporter substrate-binding protein n=1 Tax=Dermatophilus congolensis TaxID=1863 RepID=UPI001AAE5896|nr:ABC transporter substrate-binding protein [Dermatophilus congolensis]MBO3129138.1 ABC transporter substrate-binding protein [Dermatophilus congolensis]MBO3132225.1 ABC transporter substrate-binding protein [Dermatophilus congolensis]MBO3133614.1 ABC transporter substrate-binding protein [Dermatophilus congolensis]MBO3135847.1 ABC transporter substrate-binding protein [Dermatophilus congolensis]MBO3138089.1 ABC transporter substrate-binding protein [Dermatophilus congolensis]